ncbi:MULTISPECIES: GNAT family N-acetyltransferase [Falsihalocynthiibacter]|uniref:GNAT family N-acetyltransferase n=1 Tax=Falsihalocynthiibacter TaxID=2854182 RepID=UPI003001C145
MDAVWANIEEDEWGEAACASLASLQQSYEYGEICGSFGLEVMRARLTQESEQGYAQVLVRSAFGGRRLALLSRGPIWPDGVDRDVVSSAALHKTIPMSRASIMMATPNGLAPLVGIPMMSGATVAEISLMEDDTAQRAFMHGKWRNRLVQSEGMDLNVEPIAPTPALIEMLLARDAKQQKRRGYRNLPPRFLRRWAEHYPEKTHILVSRSCGKINAAMVFLRHGGTATYHLGWREVEAHIPVHNLMLWQGMRLLAHLNIKRLDLGLLDTHNSPNLARFKLGSGARARCIGKTYLLRSS